MPFPEPRNQVAWQLYDGPSASHGGITVSFGGRTSWGKEAPRPPAAMLTASLFANGRLRHSVDSPQRKENLDSAQRREYLINKNLNYLTNFF